MRTSRSRALGLCVVAAAWMAGCGALSSASAPGDARFFAIEPIADRPGDALARAASATLPGLQLGRVTGASHLEERVVRRETTHEVDYYREIRWTEAPERFLERLLSHVLFEERGLAHRVSGTGPMLDVRLVAFDETRTGPNQAGLARAQAVAMLRDGGRVIWEQTLTVEVPVLAQKGGDPVLETVDAMSGALRGLADRIADRVIRGTPVSP